MAICIADGGAATVRDLPSSGLIHNHRTVVDGPRGGAGGRERSGAPHRTREHYPQKGPKRGKSPEKRGANLEGRPI